MMKKTLVAVALSAALIACKDENKTADAAKPAEAAKTEQAAPAAASTVPEADQVSYAVGMNIGNNVKRNIDGLKEIEVSMNQDAILRGIGDVLAGKTAMTEEQQKAVLEKFQGELETKQKAAQEKAEAKAKAEGEENKKKGAEFLAANGKKEGWTTLKSGLQYKVVTEGKGDKPKETDQVKVHYAGTLIDGSKFDSSYDRNEPATFGVNQVIKGWVEALQLMPVGSKWQLAIPADLAYGEAGRPGIPANSVLLFDVELLDIVKPAAEKDQK